MRRRIFARCLSLKTVFRLLETENRKLKTVLFGVVALLLMSGVCLALGGKVSYPDGTPAVGATVSLVDSNGVEQTTTCNANSKFQFSQIEGDAKIQINAPDGKNYAPVVLPAAVFESGETAIMLQPK